MKNYPDNPKSYIANGLVLTRMGEKGQGLKAGKKALAIDSSLHFDFAALMALQNRKIEAIEQLEKSLESGYRDIMWIKINPDLYSLHNEPKYKNLIKKYFQQ